MTGHQEQYAPWAEDDEEVSSMTKQEIEAAAEKAARFMAVRGRKSKAPK